MSRTKSFFSFINEQIIYSVLLAFLFIIPIVVIPYPYITNNFIKIGFLALVVTISVVIWFFKVLRDGSVEGQSKWFLLALFSLPVTVLLSSFFGIDRSVGLFGFGSSVLTFYFVTACAFLVYVVAINFNTKNKMFFGYVTLLISAALLFLFHIIRMFMGPDALSLGLFTTGTANTVGSWNDLGIFIASIVLVACATLEYLPLARIWKTVLWIVLVVGLVLHAGTNFYVVLLNPKGIYLSVFVGLSALAICAHVFTKGYELPGGTKKRVFPIASFIVVIACSVFTMAGPEISSFVYSKAKITSQEVMDIRVTQGTTFDIIKSTYKGGARELFFGVGPARFETAWSLYKPKDINQTNFWNSELPYSSGYISTFFVTTGLLGLLAILYLFIYTGFIAYKYFKLKSDNQYGFYFGLTSFGVASLVWISAIFYVPSITIIIIGCFMLGLFYSCAIREGVIATSNRKLPTMGGQGMVVAAGSIVLIILVIASIYTWSERLVASVRVNKAVATYNSSEDHSNSKLLIVKALTSYPADAYLTVLANINLQELSNSLTKNKTEFKIDSMNDDQKFNLSQIITLNEKAVQFNPYSYQNHLSLGNVYELIVPLLGSNSAIAARDQYLAAKQLTPTNPVPNQNLARLYFKAGEYTAAETEILEAINKKPDLEGLSADLDEIRKAIKNNPQANKPTDNIASTSTKATVKSTTTKATTTKATTTKKQ